MSSESELIPRLLHTVWVQGGPPAEYEPWFESWKVNHPGWTHRVWTADEYLDLLDTDTRHCHDTSPYVGATKYAEQANIAGKSILYRFGGVVMCADFESLRPMDDVFTTDECVLWWESEGQLSAGIIGAPPGHPAVEHLVSRIPAAVRGAREAGRDITNGAGPKGLHAIWRDRTDLQVRPAGEVYPYMWFEPRPESYGDALAVHHWKATWK